MKFDKSYRLILGLSLLMIFTACDNGGNSKKTAQSPAVEKSTPNTQPTAEDAPTKAMEPDNATPSSGKPSSLTLFSTTWTKSIDSGIVHVSFAPSSITYSLSCNNGLIASVTVAAKVSNSTVSVLEERHQKTESNGKMCEAFVIKGTASYRLTNGLLDLAGDVFMPTNSPTEPGNTVPNTESSTSLTIFSTAWQKSTNAGMSRLLFTPSSITHTLFCNNGLSASVTATAAVSNSTYTALEERRQKVQSNGKICEAFVIKGTAGYRLTNGLLNLGGDILMPTN